MSELHYIPAKKLPLSQDFRALKKEGIDYIQTIIGAAWTNLNASDPGVTILDQLCFALTELGYCNDFPMQDILTDSKGKLEIKDQFYQSREILTTSPITIDDYRKYIVDDFATVENAVILAQPSLFSHAKGKYIVYLSIDPMVTDGMAIAKICRAVFIGLNRRRNIGEMFAMPQPFAPLQTVLTGAIQIANERDADKIRTLIYNGIRNFVFPKALRHDYTQLIAKGATEDAIYNGPDLKNGEIAGADLGQKTNTVHLRELLRIIHSVDGVRGVNNLQFQGNTDNLVQGADHQMLTFDLNQLKFTSNNNTNDAIATAPFSLLQGFKEIKSGTSFGASDKEARDLPNGQFRDINSYYSIQNTFPNIFAVGANAINSGASDFQIAQSRQLKGYLTLFDQVLANQFAQLANVPKLFSFKNSLCGTPSDLQRFVSLKDQFEKEHPEYPVPFLTFSPTYFYQSLYEVPDIKPLLKDNDAFHFGSELESPEVIAKRSWDAYRQDPYNRYIKGLMDLVEDEQTNSVRRNDLLNHLLARHGESPLLMDAILDGSVYSGNALKDKVIFKSLYLQNLGKLSYFRQKGYDCLGAQPIEDLADAAATTNPTNNTTDFIFNSDQIDRIEKIKTRDIDNYAALELKLNLLFGLRTQYGNYISTTSNAGDLAICSWLLQQRKGFILIENCLLYPSNTRISLTESVADGPYFEITQPLNDLETSKLFFVLQTARKITLSNPVFPAIPTVHLDKTSQFDLKYSETLNQKNWTASGTDGLFFAAEESQQKDSTIAAPMIELIFPDFIPQFNTAAFKERLDLFLDQTLPPEVSYQFRLMDRDALRQLIPAFTDWHNSLRNTNSDLTEMTPIEPKSATLITLLHSPQSSANA